MSFELFADRFQNPRRLFEDPLFTLWAAEDQERRREVWVQALWSPGLREDVGLVRQLEALQAFEEAARGEAPEWIAFGDQGLLVRERISGRPLSEVAETQRDEVYLLWLRQALETLARHHDAGLCHLAQNRHSWVLTPDGEGGERLVLADLALFPDLPLGFRMHPANLVAVAPEFFQDAPLDARADLYALACLILLQRSPKVFERIHDIGAWIDLHLGGRVAALVPKTSSPLNELLRKLLQADPRARPADTRAALAEIPGAEASPAAAAPIADWIYERVSRRQATLYFRAAFDLLQAGDPRGRDLIESAPGALCEAYPGWIAYLRAESARRGGDETAAQRAFREMEASLASRPDPRLKAFAALSELRLHVGAGEAEASDSALSRAEAALQGNQDPELAAELHLEKAAAAAARLDATLALREYAEAWRLLRESEASPLREAAGLGLAELLGSHGRAEEAWEILQDLTAAKEPRDPAGLDLAAALTACAWAASRPRKAFYRGKSRISAQKDLPLDLGLGAELRLYLAQGRFRQDNLGRELRVLKVRARSQEGRRGYWRWSSWRRRARRRGLRPPRPRSGKERLPPGRRPRRRSATCFGRPPRAASGWPAPRGFGGARPRRPPWRRGRRPCGRIFRSCLPRRRRSPRNPRRHREPRQSRPRRLPSLSSRRRPWKRRSLPHSSPNRLPRRRSRFLPRRKNPQTSSACGRKTAP